MQQSPPLQGCSRIKSPPGELPHDKVFPSAFILHPLALPQVEDLIPVVTSMHYRAPTNSLLQP